MQLTFKNRSQTTKTNVQQPHGLITCTARIHW